MAEPARIEFLKRVNALSAFHDDDLVKLATDAAVLTFDTGQTVLTQGESGHGLYIVYAGSLRLFATAGGVEKSICLRGPGELLGEISALREAPGEYSVKAATRSAVLFVARDRLLAVLAGNKDAERFLTQYIVIASTGRFLSRFLSLQQQVSREDLAGVVNKIGMKKAAEGQVILAQGSSEDQRLYVVQSGLVRLDRQQRGAEYTVELLGAEDIFGEAASLDGVPHPESAVAARDSVVFVIPQATVAFLVERNPGLRQLLKDRIARRDHEFARQQRLAERRRPRLLVDLFTPRGWGNRVLRHFPLVEQDEQTDAGVASLAMICRYYKIPLGLGKLREMAQVSLAGATLESLARVGESIGFTCKALRCTLQMIQTFDLPFVACLEGARCVAVYGVSARHVWLADPVDGFRRLTTDEFQKVWDGTCLTFIPSDAVLNPDAQSGSPWVRFVRFLVPHRTMVRNIILATMVVELLGLVSPLLTQAVVDKVIVHANFGLLNILVLGAFVALLFTHVTRTLRSYLINFLIRKMDFTMMSQFYKHLLALPVSFFARRKVGDIMARFNENAKIREFLTYTAINAVLNVFMFFVYLGVMLIFNVELSLVFLAFIPPLLLLTVYATPRYADFARREFFAQADAKAVLTESLNAAETIKVLGVELPLRLKWEKKYVHALNVAYQYEFFASNMRALSRVLNGALVLAILWYGARLVIKQELTIGQLMAFSQLVGSVMAPLMALVDTWDQFYETGVSIERIGEILDLEPEQRAEDLPSRVVLPNLKGSIRFTNVSFRYGGPETPFVLKDISLDLEPGKTYAIVGSSGAGKTTLCKVLIGLHPATEGTVYADGHPLHQVDLSSYRAQIGCVMQNDAIFSGTLSENIALGDPDPDPQRIAEVGRLAGLQDFVGATPLGYEFKVGERGIGLSSGQIQRVCLARAIYHDPGLLVLDEATAALDADTEGTIMDLLAPVFQSRTTVLVAHRLSTIRRADRIVVLCEGAIAEQGNHDELLARRGIYQHLVRNQLGDTSPPA